MKIGVVGLGLIGGSMARAIKEMTQHTVYAYDVSESTMLASTLVGATDNVLNEKNIGECDIVIISLYPESTVEYVNKNASLIKKGAIVIDCCGIKRLVCSKLEKTAEENGFIFIGGHPMAGTQFWGFEHSRASMFKGASMILTPNDNVDIKTFEKLKEFFISLGFGELKFSTPEEHDRIIAFTSQLPHVISNAYIKSDSAVKHKGFSAGSYKDLSRVAKLNDKMWAELFIENGDFLADEIDTLVSNLEQYSHAIKEKDIEQLQSLLKDGADNKRRAK